MKTKLEILARLLQNKHITIEEFVTLSVKEIEVRYEYINPPYKFNNWDNPFITTCKSTSGYAATNLTYYTTDGITKS